MHNNSIDTGYNAAGTHWQGINLDDVNKIEKYKALKIERREINVKLSSSSGNDNFKLLEKFIISLSLKSQEELLSAIPVQEDVINKIFSVCVLSNNSDTLLSSIEIAKKLGKDNLDKSYLDKILSSTLADHQGVIIEILHNQKNLQHTDEVDSFLLNQLINNESDKSRELALSLLKSSSLEDNVYGRVVKLEYTIKGATGRSTLIRLMESIVTKGEKLTYNAFKVIEKSCSDQEVQKIIKQITDNELQKLPQFIVTEYKKLSNQKINDLSISLFEQGYFKLEDIREIEQLIKNKDEQLLKILECHVLKGLDLLDPIKHELQVLSQEPSGVEVGLIARRILRLASEEQDIFDHLRSVTSTIGVTNKLLDDIIAIEQYHNPYTVETLLTLAEYEPNLRDKIVEVIVKVIPSQYTQTGYGDQILNRIINFSSRLDLINILLDKDDRANLTNVTYFTIETLYQGFEEETFELLLKLDAIIKDFIFAKKVEEDFIKLTNYYLTSCITLAACYSHNKIRKQLVEMIRAYSDNVPVQYQIDSELIQKLKLLSFDLRSEKEELEKLYIIIKEEKYLPTDQQIDQVINCLSCPNTSTVSSKILLELSSIINMPHLQAITDKIIKNQELLNDQNILELLGAVSPYYLSQEIIQIIEAWEFKEALREKVACILVGIDKEYKDQTLLMLKDCMLGTNDETIKSYIVKCLFNQVNRRGGCSKVPVDI